MLTVISLLVISFCSESHNGTALNSAQADRRLSDSIETLILQTQQELQGNEDLDHELVSRLAFAVRHLHGEWEICRVLDVLTLFSTLPDEVEDALSDRFVRREFPHRFAGPKAAGLLLKVSRRDHDARHWLEMRLRDEDRGVRVSAAVALGSAGHMAHDSVGVLASQLTDSSPSLRVAAASALLQILADPETANGEAHDELHLQIVSVLTEALKDKDHAFTVRPYMISEWGPTHKHVAAAALGKVNASRMVAARALITQLRDDDEFLRLVALRSLGQLGCRDEFVTSAIRRSLKDTNGAVAAEAGNVLKVLSDND